MATKLPVVLIHGVLGFGRQKPLWNSRWAPPYWPERQLREMEANVLMVDVGVLSSDHDRACEAFFQLYGGRVDYGEQHSVSAGHDRFGEEIPKEKALHPHWSEDNPVHLLGHSFGSTTAIELYQLLCDDFFGVGSSHTWVRSIVSIAGPLSGSVLPHAFGLHASPPIGEMPEFSVAHALGSSLALWFRLHNTFRVVRGLFPFRMKQWESRTAVSIRELVSTHGPTNGSWDLAVYNLLPKERMERNSRLRDMDKVFLISIASNDIGGIPTPKRRTAIALVLAASITLLLLEISAFPSIVAALLVLAVAAVIQSRRWVLLFPSWRVVDRCVDSLHAIFPGFDRDQWRANDGVVNVHATLKPWAAHWDENPAMDSLDDVVKARRSSSSASTAASEASDTLSDWSTPSSTEIAAPSYLIDDDVDQASSICSDEAIDDDLESLDDSFENSEDYEEFGHRDATIKWRRGKWYVRRVKTHHMAGTYFDSDAPELLRSLFAVMAQHFELEEC